MAVLATHIYRRGARYWWRRALPRGLTGTKHSVEIRLTLRTHVPVTARWRGRLLDAVLDQTLAQIEDMRDKTGTLPRALIEKLVRDALLAALDEAEAARAQSPVRGGADVAAAAARQAERARLAEALKANDLAPVADQIDALCAAVGGPGLREEDRHLVGRSLLRALIVAAAENERREHGTYLDDAAAIARSNPRVVAL
jgi:type IV secretory pathway VirJ component